MPKDVTPGKPATRRYSSEEKAAAVVRRSRLAVAGAFVLAAMAACGEPEPSQPQTNASPDAASAADRERPSPVPKEDPSDAFVDLEDEYAARLGVFAVDTGSGAVVQHRADERFAYASTFKALAAAALLHRTTARELQHVIPFGTDDLVPYSPVTEKHVDTGLTLGRLAEAAVRDSDNTAANLMLDALGGPDGLQRALRALGDDVTISSREEPELNETGPQDPRDTSTPRAFATVLRGYAVDGRLNRRDQNQLLRWMRGNATGDTLVEAGLPPEWRVVDKSGAATYGTRNDIAVAWPPRRAPIVIAVFSDREAPDATYEDMLLERATRVVVRQLR